jgi:hypothetical protein
MRCRARRQLMCALADAAVGSCQYSDLCALEPGWLSVQRLPEGVGPLQSIGVSCNLPGADWLCFPLKYYARPCTRCLLAALP